jgi:threonine dehydrogenase-like Zn-dependent dehydrogenase
MDQYLRSKNSTDVIIKVKAAALCGSDLHFCRGQMKVTPGFIVGHEFTGIISEISSSVKTFKIGDGVVGSLPRLLINRIGC